MTPKISGQSSNDYKMTSNDSNLPKQTTKNSFEKIENQSIFNSKNDPQEKMTKIPTSSFNQNQSAESASLDHKSFD